MNIGHHYNLLTKLTPCINNIIELHVAATAKGQTVTLKRILCAAKTYTTAVQRNVSEAFQQLTTQSPQCVTG